ncbi:hypothetical protein BaRGS_00030453 [Batillaria attramentaria]|uniref:Uncharacterized protein n=1 Tax=Batillaria attramentaria TaxID=370345 RepID=A0ABD0JU58_9CAEN
MKGRAWRAECKQPILFSFRLPRYDMKEKHLACLAVPGRFLPCVWGECGKRRVVGSLGMAAHFKTSASLPVVFSVVVVRSCKEIVLHFEELSRRPYELGIGYEAL